MGEATHVEGDTIWKFEPTKFLHEGSQTSAEIRRAKQSNRCVQDGLQSHQLDFRKSGEKDTSIVLFSPISPTKALEITCSILLFIG